MKGQFRRQGTLGVEEEFYIVDPESLRPVEASDEVLSDIPPDLEGFLDPELFQCVLETKTRTVETVDEMREEIVRTRNALKKHVRSHGYELLAAGMHPAAKWRELRHTERDRYRRQVERVQLPHRRNLTAGLHVHIGIDDPDKAIWIVDEMRKYLPLILALSVNSPFWNAELTGLKSSRALIFDNLPNGGIPTKFGSWKEYQRFEKRMIETGSIEDRGAIWWYLRPHTDYGTVEIRTPDAQTDPAKATAFVELVRGIVLGLAERYERGEHPPDMRHEAIEENKFRALRYGHEASFLWWGEVVDMREVLDETLGRFDIDGDVGKKLLETSGAQKQIEAFENGDIRDSCGVLRL